MRYRNLYIRDVRHEELELEFISIATAMTLTKWSESTIRRRIADGSLTRKLEPGVNGRSMVDLDSIKAHIDLALGEDELGLVQAADAGNSEAQTDLALIFLSAKNAKGALYWLELAIKQDNAAAMYHLGVCHIEGNGVPKDENLGLMWISKAAVHGHLIAQGQMQTLRTRLTQPGAHH